MASSLCAGGQLAGPPTLQGQDYVLFRWASQALAQCLPHNRLPIKIYMAMRLNLSLTPFSLATSLPVGLSPPWSKNPLLPSFSLRPSGQIPFRPVYSYVLPSSYNLLRGAEFSWEESNLIKISHPVASAFWVTICILKRSLVFQNTWLFSVWATSWCTLSNPGYWDCKLTLLLYSSVGWHLGAY